MIWLILHKKQFKYLAYRLSGSVPNGVDAMAVKVQAELSEHRFMPLEYSMRYKYTECLPDGPHIVGVVCHTNK